MDLDKCDLKQENSNVKQVEAYKQSVLDKAEDLVRVKFPVHIVQLNKLLEDPRYQWHDLSKVHQDIGIPVPPKNAGVLNASSSEEKSKESGTPVLSLPFGSVPINTVVTDLVDTIKPLIRELVDEANLLKMWVAFLIPKIEDGNNFGVGIQEETLEEIRSVEADASAFYDLMARYFINRGKLLSRVAKYPHIADYRRAVTEMDEKQFMSLKITLTEMRNHYAALHDMIIKNLEKIKKPRSENNHRAMY